MHETVELVIMSITIVNETLAYIYFYRDDSNADALKATLCFFTPTEISEVKHILIQDKFQNQLKDSLFIIKCQKSSVQLAHKAELNDIIGALALLETTTTLDDVEFTNNNNNNNNNNNHMMLSHFLKTP